MRAFLRDGLGELRRRATTTCPATRTSRLSAHLRFGCVSPLELALEARERRGGAPFVRQLCWRDFHHQVLAANPALPHRDYRPRGDRWSRSQRALEAWREGRTGYPLVDAGDAPARRRGLHAQPGADDRRLLPHQGPLHRLARRAPGTSGTCSATARSPTTPATGSGWRGPATTPAPTACSTRCARPNASTPTATYVRRYLPELESVRGKAIFRPWLMEGFERARLPRADRRPRRGRGRLPGPPRALSWPERTCSRYAGTSAFDRRRARRIGRWDGWR